MEVVVEEVVVEEAKEGIKGTRHLSFWLRSRS
jgi:hypothetical protein